MAFFLKISETRKGIRGPSYRTYYTGSVDNMPRCDMEFEFRSQLNPEHGYTDRDEAEAHAERAFHGPADYQADVKAGRVVTGSLICRSAEVIEF